MVFSIVRIVDITVSRARVLFTESLDPDITINNVSITSSLASISDPEIISVSVDGSILEINFRAIFPNTQYKLSFNSLEEQPFQSINGERLVENGSRNIIFITSPGEKENPIRDFILENATVVYETEEPSLVRDLVTNISNQYNIGQINLGTVRSGNYLSIQVNDEAITRDDGPVDRFANGGVFEVLRVGSTPTRAQIPSTIEFNQTREASFKVSSDTIINTVISDLTNDAITLKGIDVINERIANDELLTNSFNGLKIKLANKPIAQIISVMLIRDNLRIPYDIERFGYALNDNRYDTQTASINVNLADNEFELSTSSLTNAPGGFLIPRAGDEIRVSYIFRRIGRDVDPASIELSANFDAIREETPAVITRFTLENAPIVDVNDEIPVTGGVEFLNTQVVNNQLPFTTNHPAFVREIRFDITRLPSQAGEYSIDYENGEVYVFGEDGNNQGTGESPPVANYKYRDVFIQNLDYTINSDRDEISLRSSRNLGGIEAKVRFNFEDTFSEGVDYRLLSHVESLNERVNNNLIGDFTVTTQNAPVSNVFRVLNETTGELYTPLRFNDTSITFTGNRAPRTRDVIRERATFERVASETLFITDELTNNKNFRILQSNLNNNNLTGRDNRFIGANFNTSATFSRTDIFIREFFFESKLFSSVSANLNRLEQIGDYIIDYENGIVYVAVVQDQNTDIGDISYQHANIITRNDHILRVNNIYRSQNPNEGNLKSFGVGAVTDTGVRPLGVETSGERFINNNPNRPIVIGSYQNGEDGIIKSTRNTFVANSAIFSSADVGRTLRIGAAGNPPVEDFDIISVINENEIVIDRPALQNRTGVVWVVLDLSEGAPKTITLQNNIVTIQNIYDVEQLGTLPANGLDGYFDFNRDRFENNVITLGSSNSLNVGDAVLVDYNFGNIFVDYNYLQDEIVISYEYGYNSLDWSISDSLRTGEEYFVTYRYGALRESLLSNFGSLTQIPELTNFSPTLDREVYRDIVRGTLQSFIEGPTIPSIERLVESFTDVTPDITESVFGGWTLGRDHLHLRQVETKNDPEYDLGKFANGIIIDGDQSVKVPALSHVRLNEGTIETWVRPTWPGNANDSTITFDLLVDGYRDPSRVYIGFSGLNPTSIPFSLNIEDEDPNPFSEPSNIDDDTGYFIWYDEALNRWNLRWREQKDFVHEFTGTIQSSGQFFNVVKPVGPDGYEINEVTDVITSTINNIEFEAFIDGYDVEQDSNTFALDGITFSSGDLHYIFDMAQQPSANRMAIFKDGAGYLNFQVWDNTGSINNFSTLYNLSANISDWEANELHHVAVSWKFNSAEEKDEMHLFVDGFEVPNLFKYGGNPIANSSFNFGDVAEEIVISSALRPIVGAKDGNTEFGNNLFRSLNVNFSDLGVQVGDQLYLLENNQDGVGDPNNGLPYIITGVGENTLTVNRNFTLTLGNVGFSINQVTATITTPVNFQDFIVVKISEDGTETELNGLTSTEPDYSIRRGANFTHVITINDGVLANETVVIKSLGLVFKRCKERIFKYGETDQLRLNTPPPVSLGDVDIRAIIIPRTLVSTGGGFGLVGTVIGAQLVTLLQSFFNNVCQPSNNSAGRKLRVTLSGDNINYDIPGNQVIISGQTASGAEEEILLFTQNGHIVTTEFWTRIDSITVSIIPIDATQPLGAIEVAENKPINESENNGDFAEIVDFSNGIFTLETFGTGGDPFILKQCTYEVDYPTFLRIPFDGQPDTFCIGSDFNGTNQFDGTIDEFRILDTISTDTRTGETLEPGERSITTDFNSPVAFETNSNTLFLAHFDNNTLDSSNFIDRFEEGFRTSTSVNSNFGESVLFDRGSSPFIVNNAAAVFNNNEGSIEFWVSPLDDTNGDPNFHYYVDMTAVVTDTLESATSTSVILPRRAREIESVRLLSDTTNTGTNYFDGGSLSNVDSKTISLGIPLPAQNIQVKITYVPLDSQGDRVSIFRDPVGAINFFMSASGVEHMISVPIDWKRHTWHRVMVMWKTNTPENQDRIRLFVDGEERGTIRYGTGLIYGTGVIYGQAEIRPGVNRFLVTNIDLTDTFSRIFIGADVNNLNSARARIDNIRFSEIQRLNALTNVNGVPFDANYVANTNFAIPVVEDVNTTLILNFTQNLELIKFLTTIINPERGIFRFQIDVIDSFDKVIGNQELEELLRILIKRIKPAHTEDIVRFLE